MLPIAKRNQLKELHGTFTDLSGRTWHSLLLSADTSRAFASFDSLQTLSGDMYTFFGGYLKKLMVHIVEFENYKA